MVRGTEGIGGGRIEKHGIIPGTWFSGWINKLQFNKISHKIFKFVKYYKKRFKEM